MQNSLNPIYILCTANLHLRLRRNIFFRTKCILFLTDQKSVCMGIFFNIYLTKQSIIFTLHKNVTTSHSSLSGIAMVVSELESKELIYIYGSYIYLYIYISGYYSYDFEMGYTIQTWVRHLRREGSLSCQRISAFNVKLCCFSTNCIV